MDSLLPVAGRDTLARLTCDILAASGRLTGQVHAPEVLRRVAGLVRAMNCYYSNLIEGHKTTPRDIERALRQDFSADETQRNHQQLGLAHIAVEKLMVERLSAETVDVYGSEFLCWLHREFYQRLPEPVHWAKTSSGKAYRVEPGRLRHFMVDVGRHTPPQFDALPRFLGRFHQFYNSKEIIETDRLTAIAAAHHRLAWIHPFGDGNGRVIRLHSQALMIHHGLDGNGLWTLSRDGLACWKAGGGGVAKADACACVRALPIALCMLLLAALASPATCLQPLPPTAAPACTRCLVHPHLSRATTCPCLAARPLQPALAHSSRHHDSRLPHHAPAVIKKCKLQTAAVDTT